MTARLFKIPRRRPGVVDLYAPLTYGNTGYRVKWATNFDAAPTTIITSTNVGFVDPAININTLDSQPTTGKDVRIVFNPATYTIDDTKPFWLIYVPVVGGVEGTPSAPTLILPDSANKGVGIITIHGNAPSAATFAGSLQIDLPYLAEDFHIHNEDGSNNLFVATDTGGAETQLKPDTFSQFTQMRASQGSLWVRGGGGVVAFSARFTLAFPR
jgi:hypothetical protein